MQPATTTHNHPEPPKTIHNHPQLPTTIYIYSQPSKTTHNYPQLPKTIHNHPKSTPKMQNLSQIVMLLCLDVNTETDFDVDSDMK